MATTSCPQCQTRLKLPDERLHSKVRCPSCGTVFEAEPVPAQAASSPRGAAGGAARSSRSGSGGGGKRHARNAPKRKQRASGGAPKGLVGKLVIGAVAIGGIVALFIYMDPTAEKKQEDEFVAPKAQNPTYLDDETETAIAPMDHPGMQRLKFVRSAVENFNQASLKNQLDVPGFYKATADASAPLWTALPRTDQLRFSDELSERLVNDETMRELAAHEPTTASYLEYGDDRVVLALRADSLPERQWHAELTQYDGKWSLASLSGSEYVPPAAEEADKGPMTAERYIKENMVQIEGGDGARIYKGEVGKVEYVPGSSPEDILRYEKLLAEVLGDEGLVARKAREQLKEIGHPAVPVVLNRLAELPLNSDPDRLMLIGELNGILVRLSHRESPFPMPGMTRLSDDSELAERRQLTIEGWYGWWSRWGHRWDAWKEHKGIVDPEPDRRRGRRP